MKAAHIGRFALQMHLAFLRFGWSNAIASLLCLAGAVCWLWWLPYQQAEAEAQQVTLNGQRMAMLAMPAARPEAAISPAQAHLAAFYAMLGDRRRTEGQVRILFDIAHLTGLALEKGEYKSEYDRNSHSYTYQILLPVTGSYSAIRHFCEKVLLAIPFASLDEISFKRDAIGSGMLDARLRFTLHLSEAAVGGPGPEIVTRLDKTP